ncbi:MAG: nucleotidyltransferase domain-containing protein [bacterium]|nr:nucleotidyltransferase domain-containing protein [bacterium]
MLANDWALALELKKRLPDTLRMRIKQIRVFGSRAKGTAMADSDLDILILVDYRDEEIVQQLRDVAYDIMYDNGFKIAISLKIFAEKDFYSYVREGFSFYRNVEKESILV